MSKMLGIIGKKEGMTRLFQEDGSSIPVTVILVSKNVVSQIKTDVTDNYNAVQVAYGKQKPSRVSQAMRHHFAKAEIDPAEGTAEFRLDSTDAMKVGQEITLDIFKDIKEVDVISKSKGRGFSGGIRRHNFRRQPATHGTTKVERAIGSTGQCQDPGRVIKGKKMPGQYGNTQTTIQKLAIMKIDVENGALFVKGSVPGHRNALVKITPSIKSKVRAA